MFLKAIWLSLLLKALPIIWHYRIAIHIIDSGTSDKFLSKILSSNYQHLMEFVVDNLVNGKWKNWNMGSSLYLAHYEENIFGCELQWLLSCTIIRILQYCVSGFVSHVDCANVPQPYWLHNGLAVLLSPFLSNYHTITGTKKIQTKNIENYYENSIDDYYVNFQNFKSYFKISIKETLDKYYIYLFLVQERMIKQTNTKNFC